MNITSLWILLSLVLSSCGKATSDIVSELRALPEGSSTSANLIDGAEQTVTLIYDSSKVSNPTSCSVTEMSEMFRRANDATPNTTNWDKSSVTDMSGMFKDAYAANPNTSNRDTSSVTNMGEMFRDATSADPDMSGWNFSSIANMFGMFNGILISTTNYDNLLTQLDATAGSGVVLDAGSSQFTSGGAAATARANLVSDSWTINDGGSI